MNFHWSILPAGAMWLGAIVSVIRWRSTSHNKRSCEQGIAEVEKEHPDAAAYGSQFDVEAYETLDHLDAAVDRWEQAEAKASTASVIFFTLAVVFTVLAVISLR